LEAKAVEKYIRISSSKVKLVIDLIKDKSAEDAIDLLALTPRAAAVAVKKAIQSAVANAVENNKVKEENLFISNIYVNEGPTLKRFKPRARGRASRIRKRTSHITVIVSDGKAEKVEEVKKIGSKSKS
jgi:large subunit ribosomal protein L22